MPQVKASELRDQHIGELEHRLEERERELLQLRAQQATGQLDNPHRLRLVRKEIARIITVLEQKRRQAEGESKA